MLTPCEHAVSVGIAVAALCCMGLLPSIALLTCVASGCVMSDSSLRVSNRSDFEIHEMYVTPVGSPTWGSDLLGGDVLMPGESMFVGIDCGTYDAMLIDETGSTCEVSHVGLCFDSADWVIRNNTCSVFAARAAAK